MSKEQNTPGIARRRFHAYPQYKGSGVERLGEIPAHWDITRTKEQFCIVNGSTPSSSEPLFWGGDIVWVTPDDLGELHESRLGDSSRKITEDGYKSCGTSIVPKGSIVVSTRAPIGYVAIATTNLCTNQGCKSLVPKRLLNNGFFYYQLSSAKFELESRGQGSTFRELSKDKLGQIILAKPSEPEQHAIAAFLDRETAKIDALIEKKGRLIELLQEKRKALITQAVTKGLDPTVPMKDSGVEWLGKIPAHWEVNRLKFVLAAPLKYGANEAAELDNPDLPRYVRITDIDESDGLRNETFKSLPAEVAKEYLLQEGDLLFARSGATAGKTFLYRRSWGTCAFAGYLIRARLDSSKACLEFIRYFTASMSYWQWLASTYIQATIQNVSAERYASLSLPLPPVAEQRAVAAFLDRQTAKIDALVTKIREAVTSLREYRTAFISAAVTGKIDVREA